MISDQQFIVILPAAGSGTRFGSTGGAGDKLLVDIGSMSVLQRSVAAFAHRAEVTAILVVTGEDRFEPYALHLSAAGLAEKVSFVAGGRERWESVLFGLRHAQAMASRYVAIHDAARPLVSARMIDEAFAMAWEKGVALPCVPEPATLKRRSSEGLVEATVDRRGLYQAQTPQCFEIEKLLHGYEDLLETGRVADLTDDSQVYERMGWPVPITAGDPSNVKITTSHDVAFAEAIVGAWKAQ